MGYGSGLRAIFPDLTYQCNPQVEAIIANMRPGARALDLGAGGRRLHKDMITVDFVDAGGTDIVSNVTSVPLADGSVDLIIATGLLEHVENERAFMVECQRLLCPGGIIHIEVPFMYPYHEDPIDMRRYTVPGLEELLGRYGLAASKSGFHIGPSVAIVMLNAYYASILFEGGTPVHKIMSNAAFWVASILGYPFKFLDKYLQNKKSAHRLASGIYVTAVKASR